MRYGDAGISSSCDAAGDTGDKLERDPGSGESLCFLAAPPEDVWVAALEADDRLPRPAEPHEECVDLLLGNRRIAGLFANVDPLRLRTSVGEQGVGGEPVVDHH